MTRRTWWLVGLLLLCGAGVARASDGEGCPQPRALARRLGVRSARAILAPRCTPGLFPRPGLVVVYTLDSGDESSTLERIALLGPRLLADTLLFDNSVMGPFDPGHFYEVVAVQDIDGDGRDEIVLTVDFVGTTTLQVMRLAGRRVKLIKEVTLTTRNDVTQNHMGEHDVPAFHPPDVAACAGKWRIERTGKRARLIVERAVVRGANAANLRAPECAAREEVELR